MLKMIADKMYLRMSVALESMPMIIIPYLRRCVRLLALPYCYFYLIDWEICKESKIKVAWDLLYIFFRLKYYPDNYSLCKLWEVDKKKWKYYYGSIYDPYQRRQLTKNIQQEKYKIVFDDKNICYQMCKSANFPLPEQFACIGPEDDYVTMIKDIFNKSALSKIILKPIEGSGGKGIAVICKNNNGITVTKHRSVMDLLSYTIEEKVVVQEYLTQHNLLNDYSISVNTIRIVTMLAEDNSVLFLGAYLRFGINEAMIDNISTGGIGVGVDIESGELHDIAYGFQSKKYEMHPDSKIKFKGFIIPNWSKILELARNVQQYFSFYKLLGLDIAITNTGPVIIELNSEPDIVALEMLCGPILVKKEILKQFETYGLLINGPSKQIVRSIDNATSIVS